MRLPFISRFKHEVIVKAIAANSDTRLELIEALKQTIISQRAEITHLEATLKAVKCNDYTSGQPKEQKRPEPIMPARAGWRVRAQMASEATIPQVGDSAKALEAKVAKEGGKI